MNKKDKTKAESNVRVDILLRATHIFDNFKDFSDGVRVIFLLHRNKEGGKNGSHMDRTCIKAITKNSEEFKKELIRLVDEKERSGLPYRIYSCVNSRDIEKAIRQFKLEMLESDYYGEEERHGFYYDCKNRFISSLMTPASRLKDQSYFIIDVDNEEGRDVMGEALTEVERCGGEIVKQYPTKNGWHIVTKPFNPTEFKCEGVEIKKDALLLLDF